MSLGPQVHDNMLRCFHRSLFLGYMTAMQEEWEAGTDGHAEVYHEFLVSLI